MDSKNGWGQNNMTLKEKAVMSALSPAMGIINAIAPELSKVKPENPVSQFVHENLQILFLDGKEDDMSKFLSKVFVAQANHNPELSLAKLLSFYEAFRIFYTNYLAERKLNEEK